MIIATHKCGCPPKENKPSCSPCCTAGKSVRITDPVPNIINNRCQSTKSLKSILSRPKVDETACCPIEPPKKVEVPEPKLRSEIKERGLPYKEIEAIINDNRLVIRTQKEPPKEEFDPPCDCTEDTQQNIIDEDKKPEQTSGNRTVTLFPQSKDLVQEEEETTHMNETEDMEDTSEKVSQNPNIFRLRVWKKSKDGQDMHMEFQTPRPWSKKKRLEYTESLYKKPEIVESEAMKIEDGTGTEEEKKGRKRGRKRKRRRRKSVEVTGRPPCGSKNKRKSVNCGSSIK